MAQLGQETPDELDLGFTAARTEGEARLDVAEVYLAGHVFQRVSKHDGKVVAFANLVHQSTIADVRHYKLTTSQTARK